MKSKRELQSIQAVLTVARLKEARYSKLLQSAEICLAEQRDLFDMLAMYGAEYRGKISTMDQSSNPLTPDLLLQRTNLFGMINHVDTMKNLQSVQIRIAETELQRTRLAYQKARLYVDNLEDFEKKKKKIHEQEKTKRDEKSSYDEYLTRFSAPASNIGS